ncbi:UPF0149 family protein [Paraburkholderia sediminicola]|nr:UPF0149 family protein [Paraburkholderia sediminicola]
MKHAALLALPLTDAEIEQLDDFLMSDLVSEEAMDVSMMDGFMTALASGPNLFMPTMMLRWIWDTEHGIDQPAFASAEDAERIMGLIIRHWNGVNATLRETPHAYEPLVLERNWKDGRMLSIIDEWCMGYYKGIALDQATWSPLIAQHPEWFTAILLYGTEAGWEELKRRKDSLDQHQAFADSLAGSVRHIDRYWMQQRQQQAERGDGPTVIGRPQPLRGTPKIGRNDPCPCGSGKKYKRCHGAAEAVSDFPQSGGRSDWPHPEHLSSEMEEGPVHSPLSQRLTQTRNGTAVEIEIYDDGEGGWLLEIVDEFGNSTVWDDPFPTDSAALAEALNTIDSEGIASVIGAAPTNVIRH